MKNYKTQMLIVLTLLAMALATTIPQANALTWSAETRLTTDPKSDWSPALTQTSDGRIWVLWHTYKTGNGDIFYKIYDGATWLSDTQLTTDSNHDINPAIFQDSDSKIWVFWASNRTGRYEIFYRTSPDNGVSWSADTQITYSGVSQARRPSAMQAADHRIWVVYYTGFTGNDELFYKTYDGTSWSSANQLTDNPNPDLHPSIIQTQDGKIWVFWSAYRTGDYELYYKTSTDNGTSWSDDTQLTDAKNSWDELPSAMQAKDGKIWVVWEADRSGTDYDLYYKTFESSWSSDNNLVGNSEEDVLPSIFQAANKTIWVAWSSSRLNGGGDFDLFYKLGSNEHDVAVTSVTPSTAFVYKGYSAQVQVNVNNYGLYSETFTVTAYYDSTPIGTQTVTNLASGASTTLTFPWDTTSVAYGNYIVSATASAVPSEEDLTDNSLSDGTVMVTIPGDVNGDRNVNIGDIGVISAHWYPGPPIGPLGYDSKYDVNKDGAINIAEVGLASANWNESW